MKLLTDIIIRYRPLVLVLVVFLTLFLGYQMVKVKLNADFATYLKQDDPLVQQYNKLGDKFGGRSTAMVLIETDDIFSAQNLKLIGDLTEAYRLLEEVSYVTSLTNILDFKKVEGEVEVGKLITEGDIPTDRDELRKLKEYVMSKEMHEGNLVSYDGTTTMIALRLAPDVNEYSAAVTIRTSPDIIQRISSFHREPHMVFFLHGQNEAARSCNSFPIFLAFD